MDKNRRQLIMIGHWEGVSYLVLLLIAMPLKYFYNMPMAVRLVGGIHGILFVAFCLVLFQAYRKMPLSFKTALIVFFLSFVPFGTFFIYKFIGNNYKVDYLSI